jgi:alpha-L-arabinofuranosidase
MPSPELRSHYLKRQTLGNVCFQEWTDPRLKCLTKVADKAAGELLTGQPADMNSVDEPMKVAATPIVVNDAAPSFVYEVPACSVVVIRLWIN